MRELDLRKMETESWRVRQQNGLFDLFFGGLMLAISISALTEAFGAPPPVRLAILAVLQFSAAWLYGVGRRRLVTPRIGVARFARTRMYRVRGFRVALAVCVLVTALLVLSTALGRSPVAWFSMLGTYALPVVVSLIVGIPMIATAWIVESPRVLIHVALFVASVFGLAVAGHDMMTPIPGAMAFGAAGIVSVSIGGVYLIRFVRNVSIKTEKGGSHGS